MDLVKVLSEQYMKKELPEMNVGDTVRVQVLVKEGNRERTQAFEGTIIAKKHGGINETITVRRISYGVGCEKVFPVHSPFCHHRPQGQGPQGEAVLPARPRGQGGQGQGAPVNQNRTVKGTLFSRVPFALLVKKSLAGFFDCAFPPSILAVHKMLFSKSLVKQCFLSGGLLYSRRALPPRAPLLLCHLTLHRGSLTVFAKGTLRSRVPFASLQAAAFAIK